MAKANEMQSSIDQGRGYANEEDNVTAEQSDYMTDRMIDSQWGVLVRVLD